jgi:acetoacetyl-CoA synthetase
MQARGLGAAVYAYDDAGRAIYGDVGELVCTKPMPSMPLYFWGDAGGKRYFDSYFDMYPGVWRHGDWLRLERRAETVTGVIYGRSDSTINRHGIRMGSAEIYEVVEAIDAIAEAFVLGIDGPGGTYWMPLFVTLAPGRCLDDALIETIRTQIRTRLSPRHVPDDVIATPGIPHTRTGKKLEVPITAIMAGHTDVSLDPRSIDNPDLIDFYREQGRAHQW